MKNFEIKKEFWIWILMALPVAYLFMVWHTLPEIVPTHFGLNGKANDWHNKNILLYLVGGMTMGMYALLTVIPFIDPKDKIKNMGSKYFKLKFALMLFMALLSILIVRAAFTKNIGGNTIFVLTGATFLFLGNYMQTVRPNYFIGIRTPWTLENELIWNKTHQLGGKLYFIAGLAVIILSFLLNSEMSVAFVSLILIATIVPIVYSYLLYRKTKNGVHRRH